MFEDQIAPQEVKEARLEICKTCAYNKLGVCKKCGCILQLKTKWKYSHCPIHKWDAMKKSS